MTEVKVMVEGYANQTENGWVASSTVCLITTENKKIITDPGCNRLKLLEALSRENLKTGDIDYVFHSHRHPDHTLLAGIFENAKHITFDMGMMYENDTLTEFSKNILSDDIEIINTPGHVNEHISLIVKTSNGKIGIAGDVIWWLDGEPQIFDLHQRDHSQAIDLDMESLVKSRKKLLAESNYIIPGHGKMFRVEK
jgi:glyoxylase-like metal-dependent hydrolase (beta-lactamase superfamily II)